MDKSKLMMIIIIVLLVLLIGTVVGVAFFLINMGGNGEEVVVEDLRPVPSAQVSLPELEPLVLGDEMILTHLEHSADGRPGTVRTSIVIGIDVSDEDGEGEAFIAMITPRIEQARSIAIGVLNGLTYDQVRTPEGRDAAGEMIMRRLQESFETNLIVSVHFSDWLVAQGR